jgi:hypothetical protein
MGKYLLVFIASLFFACSVRSQSITVDDLLSLTSISPKNIDAYLNKKGFVSTGKGLQDSFVGTTFIENRKVKAKTKSKTKPKDTLAVIRSINLYKKGNSEYYVLHTSSKQEFLDGSSRLKKAGFLYDSSKGKDLSLQMFFQKRNLSVITNFSAEEGFPDYAFILQKKQLPDPNNIQYAEDLLLFDSHEYLVSFFGQKNVKQDVYYFTEKELKKCSVLFPNTNQQVTFIWNDEATLSKLSYILISGILPTQGAVQFSASVSQNKWTLKNGIYSNISIRELLDLNGEDFEFYGRDSEFSYMVLPESKGNIDFKKIGITLGCFDCASSSLLDQKKISVNDAIERGLAMHVIYIIIMP